MISATHLILVKSLPPGPFAMLKRVCVSLLFFAGSLIFVISSDKASDVTLARGPEYFNRDIAPSGTEESTQVSVKWVDASSSFSSCSSC